MIDLHYWPTPNGWKASIALEEMELPYTLNYVNIARGEQFEPEFLAISPNNRMPAIVDHDPPGGGAPVALFESGAAFPDLQRWYEQLKTRPALRRGFDVGKEIRQLARGGPDEEARRVLFGQRAPR